MLRQIISPLPIIIPSYKIDRCPWLHIVQDLINYPLRIDITPMNKPVTRLDPLQHFRSEQIMRI